MSVVAVVSYGEEEESIASPNCEIVACETAKARAETPRFRAGNAARRSETFFEETETAEAKGASRGTCGAQAPCREGEEKEVVPATEIPEREGRAIS